MPNEGLTITNWFGLKRPNFILDPKVDADFYAPRSEVDIPELIEGLQVNLVTERPPKRFFWGIYGGGKTHTLFNISKQLERLMPTYPVYVECPSVPKKSTFLHLYHDGIMASMGQDFIIKLFADLIQNIGLVRREELLKKLKDIIGDEELSRAVASLLGDDPGRNLSFWRYISGVSVPPRDLADLGQTQAIADAEPAKLADIIVVIARVVKKLRNQTLVLVIDELDRLKSVTDEYGASTYENAFRKLVSEEQRDVALLMGCSAVNLMPGQDEGIPLFLGGEHGAILSRIGRDNLKEIPEISANDVDAFIKSILNYIVDKEQAEIKIGELEGTISETLEIYLFPFTSEAIEALKGTLGGIMTPREITKRMSDATGKAYLMKKPVITRDVIG